MKPYFLLMSGLLLNTSAVFAKEQTVNCMFIINQAILQEDKTAASVDKSQASTITLKSVANTPNCIYGEKTQNFNNLSGLPLNTSYDLEVSWNRCKNEERAWNSDVKINIVKKVDGKLHSVVSEASSDEQVVAGKTYLFLPANDLETKTELRKLIEAGKISKVESAYDAVEKGLMKSGTPVWGAVSCSNF